MQNCYSDFQIFYNQRCEHVIQKMDPLRKKKTNCWWLTRGIKSNMRKKLTLWHRNKKSKWEDRKLSEE